jgi:DNA-directed RNA polymerase subunit H (RpoH/RPB5)
MSTFEEFLKLRETVLTMLEKRGFNPEYLNRNVSNKAIEEQYNSSIDKEYVCDIFVKKPDDNPEDKYENRQAYIHFVFNNKKTKATFGSITKSLKKLIAIYNLLPIDDIAVVIISTDNMDENSDFYKLEKNIDNVVVFHYKNLMFDITKHHLVPPHIKIKSETEQRELKKNLQIESLNKLPVILRTDAVARFYHYRKGNIIKIERPSIGNMKHIVYRVVV